MNRPFEPIGGAATTQNVAVTTASQSITINAAAARDGTVRLANIGSQTVFVSFGAAAVVATSTPLLLNSAEAFSVPLGVTAVHVIASATGSTLYVTEGTGA